MEDLPVVRKIGDVIRCHRAIVKDYKGIKQFNVNLSFNSSWCLFHSSDILLKVKKGAGNQDVGPDDHYSESEESDEMETEMADGSTRNDRA